MIVGDEVVVGEAGRQLGHPALGKVAADSRERRGGVRSALPPAQATASTRASAARSRSVNSGLVA